MAVSFEKMVQIANTIKSSTIVDSHTGQEVNMAAVCVLSIGDSRHHIVPMLPNCSHCLNAMGKTCGTWVMSKWSVSGVIDTRGVSIEEAVEAFNLAYKDGDMSGDTHTLTIVKVF